MRTLEFEDGTKKEISEESYNELSEAVKESKKDWRDAFMEKSDRFKKRDADDEMEFVRSVMNGDNSLHSALMHYVAKHRGRIFITCDDHLVFDLYHTVPSYQDAKNFIAPYEN